MSVRTGDVIKVNGLKIDGYCMEDIEWDVVGVALTKKMKYKLHLKNFSYYSGRSIEIKLDYDDKNNVVYSLDKPKTSLTYTMG